MSGRPRGFTIVEMAITLTIVAILLVLGTIAVRGLLAKGRDAEREADAKALAQAIERRYNNGNTLFQVDTPADQPNVDPGSYPGNDELLYGCGWTETPFNPDTSPEPGCDYLLHGWKISKSLITLPAGNQWLDLVCWYACQPAETASQTDAAFKYGGNYVDKYVYEPIDNNGNICYWGACRRFNIYWRSEVDGTIHQIRSIHQ